MNKTAVKVAAAGGAGILLSVLIVKLTSSANGGNGGNGETTTYPCPYCSAVFYSQSELNDHIANVHSSGEQTYTCPYCFVEFETETDLADHIALNHPQQTYDCEFCDMTFDTPEELAAHIAAVHSLVSPTIYEKISSNTANGAMLDNADDVLVKVLVSNPNNTSVTETVSIAISPSTCTIKTTNPLTQIIPANSSKSFGFKVNFQQVGVYTITSGMLTYTFTVTENEYPDNPGWDPSVWDGSSYMIVGPGLVDSYYQGVTLYISYDGSNMTYRSYGLMGPGGTYYYTSSDPDYWHFKETCDYYYNYYHNVVPHAPGTYIEGGVKITVL